MASDLISKMLASKASKPSQPSESDIEMDGDDTGMDGTEVAAQEVLEAIEAGDAKALAEAIKSLVNMAKE